jgi:type IV fimbrial biogenesis protein FimT
LVTLSIAVILLTIAVPGFRDFLLNTRITSQTNDFVLAMASAKSEAVKRGVNVTVCPRNTNTACLASTTWDTGWLVFVDNDGGGTVNGADVILQVRAPLEGSNTLRAGARQRVTFQNTGFSPVSNDTFRLCDTRGLQEARAIIISAQGRARVGKDSPDDADLFFDDGASPPANWVPNVSLASCP